VGWATGIGRSGGILAPILIGALIQAGSGTGAVYSILAVEAALTTLVLVGLRKETAGKALEEITRS
jgi:putative MFS transporter